MLHDRVTRILKNITGSDNTVDSGKIHASLTNRDVKHS